MKNTKNKVAFGLGNQKQLVEKICPNCNKLSKFYINKNVDTKSLKYCTQCGRKMNYSSSK